MPSPTLLRLALCVSLSIGSVAPVRAATCTWNATSGNWSVVTNWSGCADAAGPSTRTPGPGDVALIPGGAVSFDTDATVDEFEIGSGASLTLTGSVRTLTIASALRLAGGTLSTTNPDPYPFFRVILAAGGTGQVLASSTLSKTVELENRGDLQIFSATGTALQLLDLSRLINVEGASFALGGGDARVHLDGAVPLTVRAGAILHTSGNVYIGKSVATPGSPRIESYGVLDHVGPGTLTVSGLGNGGSNAATLQVENLLSITNGTLLCNGATDSCRMQSGASGLERLDVQLASGTLDRGGPDTFGLLVNADGVLSGTGTVNGDVSLRGRLSPGADNGPPYGTIIVTGDLQVNPTGRLDVDLGGGAAGSHDLVQVGGELDVGGSSVRDGYGLLKLHLAPGFQPAMGAAIPIVTYAAFDEGSAWYRVEDDSPLDFATRFDPGALQVFPAPRLSIEDVDIVEGNAGTQVGTFTLRLSQPFPQAVTAEMRPRDGSASEGPGPAGDFLYPDGYDITFPPGVTLQTKTVQVHGDTLVEGDEAFSVSLFRNTLVNAALANGVPGSPSASATIITDDLPPDTRFVLVGKDVSGNQVRRYTSDGTFIDAWGPHIGNVLGYVTTGMCFSPRGDILATRFDYPDPTLYSAAGAVLDDAFARPPGSSSFFYAESCVFDRSGNVYIGQAGGSGSSDEQVALKKFDRHGNPLDSYTIPTGTRGTDWIDLAGNQCTLYYTSEDTTVRRYNLCTRTPLPDFTTDLTPPYCYALRLRPNGELMVACQDAVHRLSAQGANLKTYTRQDIGELDASGLFALNLDPDGTSFWTAGLHSGDVYRVDIESGAVLTTFNTGTGGVSGLAVYDELGDGNIFTDGFDPPPAPAPVARSGPSSHLYAQESQCEKQFAPRKSTMPHFMPHALALIAVAATRCAE